MIVQKIIQCICEKELKFRHEKKKKKKVVNNN